MIFFANSQKIIYLLLVLQPVGGLILYTNIYEKKRAIRSKSDL